MRHLLGGDLSHRAIRLAVGMRRRALALVGWRTLGVRAVVVAPDGRVALVRHTYTGDALYLPGGGVDRGESYAAALERELKEELDIDAAPVRRVLGAYHATAEGRDDHVLVYVVALDAAAAAAVRVADRREVAAFVWADPAAPPGNVTPATRRRLSEYVRDEVGGGDW